MCVSQSTKFNVRRNIKWNSWKNASVKGNYLICNYMYPFKICFLFTSTIPLAHSLTIHTCIEDLRFTLFLHNYKLKLTLIENSFGQPILTSTPETKSSLSMQRVRFHLSKYDKHFYSAILLQQITFSFFYMLAKK